MKKPGPTPRTQNRSAPSLPNSPLAAYSSQLTACGHVDVPQQTTYHLMPKCMPSKVNTMKKMPVTSKSISMTVKSRAALTQGESLPAHMIACYYQPQTHPCSAFRQTCAPTASKVEKRLRYRLITSLLRARLLTVRRDLDGQEEQDRDRADRRPALRHPTRRYPTQSRVTLG